jgi:hypothetical protein
MDKKQSEKKRPSYLLKAHERFEEWARENRRKFLAPYKAQINELSKGGHNDRRRTKKAIAKIIIELIKREPSHLAEDWILWTVISWLRNSEDKDFLEAAFIEERGRNRRTPKQEQKFLLDFQFMVAIDTIRRKQGFSISRACRILAELQGEEKTRKWFYPTWNPENGNQDLEEQMRKKYHEARRNQYQKVEKARAADWREMPYPYWGRDVMP